MSAWASEAGLALGQLATDEKSNEITAIPELISQIDVKKAIVTIDAMGCQREIAQKIIAEKGDYVLAVKDNQPKLHEEIQAFFSEQLEDDCASVECRRAETKERSHGREEYRSYYLAKLPEEFTQAKKWAGLQAIGVACRLTRHADGSETHETRYSITSCYLSGERFAKAVRGHWAVESSLHWVLDVTSNEDQSRARKRHRADNLARLRRLGIGLLKQHPSNHSIKGKQQMVGRMEPRVHDGSPCRDRGLACDGPDAPRDPTNRRLVSPQAVPIGNCCMQTLLAQWPPESSITRRGGDECLQ